MKTSVLHHMVCSHKINHDRFGVAFVDDGRSQPKAPRLSLMAGSKIKFQGDLTGLFENVFLVE